MRATTRFRNEVLRAVDGLMQPSGFSRRRRDPLYRKEVAPGIVQWMHLNFGLYERTGEYIVHPSVGVRFAALEAEKAAAGLRSPSAEGGTFSKMLHSLMGKTYEGSIGDSPATLAEQLVDDWKAAGVPTVARMSDINRMIESLKSDAPDEWCCMIRSERARLLPLALLHVGAGGGCGAAAKTRSGS